MKKILPTLFAGFALMGFSLCVYAEECSPIGRTQNKYVAGEPDECSYITQTRTCCRDKNWSDWDKECPQCSADQCWDGAACREEPEEEVVGEDRYDGSDCKISYSDCQCSDGSGWQCDRSINLLQGGYFDNTGYNVKSFPIPSSNPAELSGACPRWLTVEDTRDPQAGIDACKQLAKANYNGTGGRTRALPDGTKVFLGSCEIRSNCACYEGSSKKFNNLVCQGAYPTTSVNVSWKCNVTPLVCGVRECGARANEFVE